MILSIMVGNGAQLITMVGVTLGKYRTIVHIISKPDPTLSAVFALLGFLSPSNRGSLATVMMVCWSFFGWLVFKYFG